MENYAYSSYPDSGDSSPRSREIECETAVAAWDEQQQPPAPLSTAPRVKLMCSYGGRIQPRHDNQLSYVGGDTKILAVDRSIRFSAIIAKLASLSGAAAADEVSLKYQLPGEDLDALISVTNDEDLEHMMIEYDRLHRSGSKPAPRLRLFLFPCNPSIGKSDRLWFVDAPVEPPAAGTAGPDFLFGLDKGFVPPPAVKVKDPAPESVVPAVDAPPAKEEGQIGGGEAEVSPAEVQRQMQEIQRLQISENGNIPRNGSDDSLGRVYPADYYVPRVQETAPPAPPPATVAPPLHPSVYWPQDHQRSMAPAGRFASVAGGDQQFYLIPAPPGVFQGAAAGQGYYTAVQRVMASEMYRDGTAVYAMAPPSAVSQGQQQSKVAYDSGVRGQQGVDVSAGFGAGGQVAYDSAGRAVYYTGAAPTYQTVGSVAINPESKGLKPSQVS